MLPDVPARSNASRDDGFGGGERAPPNEAAASELRQKAFRLLARRERSRAEMQRLLRAHCSDSQIVHSLLDELQGRGWMSDARLAGLLVGSRRPRASASRIRQEMARRGLAPDLIADATAGLDHTDLATALALWQKRFGEPAADRSQRERQLRFLLYRGFSQSIALKVVRMAGDRDLSEIED